MTDGHGVRIEDAVENLCHQLFGCDFVLRSPQLIEQSGPKELTDVLVVVDDTAIVIQSKSLAIDISDLDDLKLGRIHKRREEAKRQLNTTLNAHTRHAHVRATTPLNIAFDLDWSWIKKKVGIITLHVADDLYGDPEFRFQYPNLVEEHKGIMVHTFLVNDLAQMTSEFSTPADVLLYLAERERCLLSGRVMIGNELDFLAVFKARYTELEEALSNPDVVLSLAPGLWERYRKDEANRIRDRDYRFRNSGVIDRLIRTLHTSVEYTASHYGLTSQEGALKYLKLIGKFGKLTRMERADIGDKLIAKRNKTKSSKYGYFIFVSEHAKTAYLFLVINEEDREKRKNILGFLCGQACHILNCSELVGLATDGAQQEGASIDALVMDVAEVRSETKLEKDLELFKQMEHRTVNEWNS
ncbi:MAG: hypothetical protein ABSH14_08630 [Verrucomicrobiia bacterium]|jgi:hypothetical protein